MEEIYTIKKENEELKKERRIRRTCKVTITEM